MNNVVDNKQVLKMFAALHSSKQKKTHRTALRKSLNILVKETKRQFRRITKTANHRNRWNGKTLISGIKASVAKDAKSGKVHLMGDFRLKFFEMGTNDRRKKKTDGKPSTGKMNARYFFKNARTSKEKEISDNLDNTIAESIKKINEQFRGR